MTDKRDIAIYLSGLNAETYDRADDPSADSEGHVITATVLRNSSSSGSMVPVRVRIDHGVSGATAASMLRKMAAVVEENPDLLSAMPGFALRRRPGGGADRKRITPEGLERMAEQLPGEERDRLLDMIDRIRDQIVDDPSPGDML